MKNSLSHSADPAKNTVSAAMQSLANTCKILQDQALSQNSPVQQKPDDSALQKNILMSLYRHRAQWDWILNQRAKKIRPRLRRVLWWCLTEIHDLNGLAAPIVVDTAVEYTKHRYSPNDAKFVNAILRNYIAKNEHKTPVEICASAPKFVQLNLSECLYTRWRSHWDEAFLNELANTIQLEAPTLFRKKPGPSSPSKTLGLLQPVSLSAPLNNAEFYMLKQDAPKESLTSIMATGQFYIQDPSTLLAPSMLQAQPGETIADLCCAPGGKALLLAEAMLNQGTLICRDRSESRLCRVRENLRDFSCATIAQGDATKPELPEQSCDGILLDVPCSNTGVLKRRPDVRWNFSDEIFNGLVVLQKEILENSSKLLKNGGRLVYSTCSIEPEENHLQIQAFLQRHSEFQLIKETQLFPDAMHDGGFAALIQKK